MLKIPHKLAEDLHGLHTNYIYNFAGELWQLLVADREERAAHYTRLAIAAFLSVLAVY